MHGLYWSVSVILLKSRQYVRRSSYCIWFFAQTERVVCKFHIHRTVRMMYYFCFYFWTWCSMNMFEQHLYCCWSCIITIRVHLSWKMHSSFCPCLSSRVTLFRVWNHPDLQLLSVDFYVCFFSGQVFTCNVSHTSALTWTDRFLRKFSPKGFFYFFSFVPLHRTMCLNYQFCWMIFHSSSSM